MALFFPVIPCLIGKRSAEWPSLLSPVSLLVDAESVDHSRSVLSSPWGYTLWLGHLLHSPVSLLDVEKRRLFLVPINPGLGLFKGPFGNKLVTFLTFLVLTVLDSLVQPRGYSRLNLPLFSRNDGNPP